MTFVGKELGVWGEAKGKYDTLSAFFLSLCIHGGNLAIMTKFLPKGMFFYWRFDCIDLSIVVELRAENLEVI